MDEIIEARLCDIFESIENNLKKIKLFIIPYGEIQKQVIMKVPSNYRMIISRRFFYRIASRVAKENKYLALATGDSLGQVASQTIENMSVKPEKSYENSVTW